MGDIYVLSVLSGATPSVRCKGKISEINGYKFCIEKLFTNKEGIDNQFEVFNKVSTLVYSRPIICNDEFQYMRFRARVL